MNELVNSISVNPSCYIISEKTNLPYIDKDRKGYVFFRKENAEEFVKENNDVIVSDFEYRNLDDFLSYLYQNGVAEIVIEGQNRKEEASLRKKDVKRKFYNSNLTASISLFKETKSATCMTYLSQCRFIVPIRVNFELTKEIVYATVHIKNGYSFLAFSDLDEYEKWAAKIAGWEPLLVNFDVMCQISKDHGYVVNPLGNILVLPGHIMEKYREYAKAAL